MGVMVKEVPVFLLNIFVWWWLIVPGVLWFMVVEVPSVFSDRVDDWWSNKKFRARFRRGVRLIGVAGLLVAAYLTFADERRARITAETKLQSSSPSGFQKKLEVRTIDTTVTPNADGTYTNSRLVEIISRCPPGMLRFVAHGKNITSSLRIKKTNQIMMLTGAGGRIGDSVFLEVENAWGKYILIVNTQNADDVIFDYSCK